jgi:hypothetical protein
MNQDLDDEDETGGDDYLPHEGKLGALSGSLRSIAMPTSGAWSCVSGSRS